MIARLWWKEARRVWPIWAFLAALGILWMGVVRWLVGAELMPGALDAQARLVTLVYMFLILL